MEDALTLDLHRMLRRGRIVDGCSGSGKLRFYRDGEPYASFGFNYDLEHPHDAWLRLNYVRRTYGRKPVKVVQRIQLTFTEPNFGGRRWWLICPFGGRRVAKLYLPPGGDKFASREEWRLVYASQRQDYRDRTFKKLFRLQRQLGCDEHWGAEPSRPRGMWRTTFQRHLKQYLNLDARCEALTGEMVSQLRRRHG